MAAIPTASNPTGSNEGCKIYFKVTVDGSIPTSDTGDWAASYDGEDNCIGVKDSLLLSGGNLWAAGIATAKPNSGDISFKIGINNVLYESSTTATFVNNNGGNLTGWAFGDGQTVDFTAVSGGGGGGGTVDAPEATALANASVNVVQGGDITTTDKLSEMFTGADITYSYSATEIGEATGDVSAMTSGDNVKISATSGATAGSYIVTVTATNAGGSDTKTISVTVFGANAAPTLITAFPNLSFGQSTSDGTYTITDIISHFTDSDNDTITIQSVTVLSGTNVTVTFTANSIELAYTAGAALGDAVIKIIVTDGTDTAEATFTASVVEPTAVYIWTETANDHTTIKMNLTSSISVPGIHVKYLSDSAVTFSADHQTSTNIVTGIASAYNVKGWSQNHINADYTDHPYLVLFGDAGSALTLGEHDLAYFVSQSFTISAIVGIADQVGNLVNMNDITLGTPPILFEDTSRDPVTDILYGDVDVDEDIDQHDLIMLTRYLVNNDEAYDATINDVVTSGTKAVTYINTKKTENNGTFGWIDVNKNNEIDIGDACRIAEKIANPSYNIIGNRDL